MPFKDYLAAVVAGLATAALTTGALAQAAATAPAASAAKTGVNDPDAQFLLKNTNKYSGGISGLDQRGCETSDKVIGTAAVPIDGYMYGGCLAKGADKNLDAVRVLIKASQATGQFRNVAYGFATQVAVHLVIGDTTPSMRVEGAGTWQGENVKVRLDWDYRVPGARLFITHANGSQDIFVAANPTVSPTGRLGHLEQPELFGNGDMGPVNPTALVAWKEKPLGVYSGASDMSPQDMLALVYLMPTNIILAGRDAADKIKASRVGRNDVLTIPVPRLGGTNLVATLDAEGHPSHAEFTFNGKKYTADYGNYLADRGDYEVYLPHQVAIQVDGKAIADWKFDWHQNNPYVVFPVPSQVAAK